MYIIYVLKKGLVMRFDSQQCSMCSVSRICQVSPESDVCSSFYTIINEQDIMDVSSAVIVFNECIKNKDAIKLDFDSALIYINKTQETKGICYAYHEINSRP
jgi:hypothetical protein